MTSSFFNLKASALSKSFKHCTPYLFKTDICVFITDHRSSNLSKDDEITWKSGITRLWVTCLETIIMKWHTAALNQCNVCCNSFIVFIMRSVWCAAAAYDRLICCTLKEINVLVISFVTWTSNKLNYLCTDFPLTCTVSLLCERCNMNDIL